MSFTQGPALQRVLLLFNACHAGELTPDLGGRPAATLGDAEAFTGSSLPEVTSGAMLATGAGRVIITACRANQFSFIGNGPLTIFGQALIEGLCGAAARDTSGKISVFDLYTYLYHAVLAGLERELAVPARQAGYAIQEPELTVLKGVGPFTVALRSDRTSPGLATTPATLPPAPRRELEPALSQALLRQVAGHFVQVAAGAAVDRLEQDNAYSI